MAVSDPHGCYDEYNSLLKKAKYNPSQDKLILLGDYVDRGQKSRQMVEQVMLLHNEWGVVALKGNHDDMFVSAINNDTEELDAQWLNNGGFQTVESYCGISFFEEGFEWNQYIKAKEFIREHYQHHIDFLGQLPLYYEDMSHIYVHAGINPFHKDWKNTSDSEFIWIREPFFTNKTGLDKTVVFGHTPCIYLHDSEDIWFSPDEDKIGIDGACAYGLQLNALEIKEDGTYGEYFVRRGTINE
ncbi:metallophosphoesterase family protein [Paenibacillus sp. FSL M7-0802]|uniref:metallophosphoesterase family protein n=1 Tax=Paenibacillus sp. FSL M7-0802 TaxID=2921536 RepID=UPI0030F663F4